MRLKQGRIRKNRRLKEPFKVRGRRLFVKFFKIMVLAIALPALAYSGWRGYKTLITTPYLAIENINVTGAQRLTREEVIELSGIEAGQNLLSFKASDAIKGIKQNPWVKKAEIKRSIPDTVAIEITEREPLALVKMDGLYVMDANGVVFKKLTVDDELDLPVVTGLTMEGLSDDSKGLEGSVLKLINELKNRGGFNLSKVSEIHVDPAFGLSVYTLEEGVRLDLGTGDFEPKLLAFEKVLKSRDGILRGVEAMDLNNREVVVRFTTNVVKEGGDRHGQKG